jgi:cbb3-type cytochrome oxidase cytochrome c subunit
MPAYAASAHGEAVKDGKAIEIAKAQATQIAADLKVQAGGTMPAGIPADVEKNKIIALIAYLQRLGVDISKPPPAETPVTTSAAVGTGGVR